MDYNTERIVYCFAHLSPLEHSRTLELKAIDDLNTYCRKLALETYLLVMLTSEHLFHEFWRKRGIYEHSLIAEVRNSVWTHPRQRTSLMKWL